MRKALLITGLILLSISSFGLGRTLNPKIVVKERIVTEIKVPKEFLRQKRELASLLEKRDSQIDRLSEKLSSMSSKSDSQQSSFNILMSKTEAIQQEVTARDVYMADLSFLWDPSRNAYVEHDLRFDAIQAIKNAINKNSY